MYELKNIGKVFTSKFVGTDPSSYKKNLLGRGHTKVEKHCLRPCDHWDRLGTTLDHIFPHWINWEFFFSCQCPIK